MIPIYTLKTYTLLLLTNTDADKKTYMQLSRRRPSPKNYKVEINIPELKEGQTLQMTYKKTHFTNVINQNPKFTINKKSQYINNIITKRIPLKNLI